MFSVYEVSGRSFRDTLENLRKVKRKAPPHQVGARAAEEDDPLSGLPATSPYAQACDTYRQTLPPPERERVVHAHQVMSGPVRTIRGSESMVTAWQMFDRIGHHQLPVVDEAGLPIGLLTAKNMLRHIIIERGEVITRKDRLVRDIMTPEIITADPVTDIRRIAAVMLDYGQSAVPVTNEQDELVGIISRSDILRLTSSDPPLSLWT